MSLPRFGVAQRARVVAAEWADLPPMWPFVVAVALFLWLTAGALAGGVVAAGGLWIAGLADPLGDGITPALFVVFGGFLGACVNGARKLTP